MAPARTAAQAKPAIERRPAPAVTTQRSAAVPAQSPMRALQQRLGNSATQDLIARSNAGSAPQRTAVAPVSESVASATTQSSSSATVSAKVSRPGDSAEIEAEETARKVVRMHEPSADTPAESRPKTTATAAAQGAVQRAEAPAPAPAAPQRVSIPGGAPLPSTVRSFMEPRFGANFGNVRIHTNQAAAQQSANLSANAFTIGEHIFFGQGRFEPQSASGRELIAHELTHTIQQSAAQQRGVVQRSTDVHVSERVGTQVQGEWFGAIPSPREYFARRAALIPGFTMLTVVIGFNPITNARVERNAGNILRGAIEMMPGGALITQALSNHGVFDRVSLWATTQFEALRDIGSATVREIGHFIESFSVTDLADPGGVWDRARAIVMRPINRVTAFAVGLVSGIVTLIKEAILRPIAALARTTRGYPLLSTVMGRDPITGESVPQGPEPLLGSFLRFIGEEETWNTMQRANNAIPRAFAWFNGALNALRGFVSAIPGLFVQAFRALEIADIILIPRAFAKLVGVFGDFAIRFVTWGANAVWTLLEIIFDVVSPGALAYIKRTGAALRSILRNPLPFVGNLVRAAKLGFLNFADHFLTHLRTGLIQWLTGALPGVYIPQAFSLIEIAKFVFSVLGLTWANIRQKLVRATSETVVRTLETGFDIVVTLVRDGPMAAWEKIKEQLANLRDMVIGGITDFVVNMVVQRAIPRLVAMFIPGAGFISAIVSIYETIMVFVNRIRQIVQVVTGFIDSIVAIAAGRIDAAATRVENALANALSLAINFLAGFAGLGRVADSVLAVFNRIRAPIDRALDWLVNWIVTAARRLIARGRAAVARVVDWWRARKPFTASDGSAHTLSIQGQGESANLVVATTPTPLRAFLNSVERLVSNAADPNVEREYANAVAAHTRYETLKVRVETSVPPRQEPDIRAMNDELESLSQRHLPVLVPLLYPAPARSTTVQSDDFIKIIRGNMIARVTEVVPAAVSGSAQQAVNPMLVKFRVLGPGSRRDLPVGFLTTAQGRDWEKHAGTDLRELYLGSMPTRSSSAVVNAVKARMASENAYDLARDSVKLQGGQLVPFGACDMSHIVDAVLWWNTQGRFTGARSDAVTRFMNDPDNYILEPLSANRSRGAELAARGVRYQDPV